MEVKSDFQVWSHKQFPSYRFTITALKGVLSASMYELISQFYKEMDLKYIMLIERVEKFSTRIHIIYYKFLVKDN